MSVSVLIPPVMEADNHHDSVFLQLEEDTVWKTPHPGPAAITVDNRKRSGFSVSAFTAASIASANCSPNSGRMPSY
jgi:hypothetical protein